MGVLTCRTCAAVTASAEAESAMPARASSSSLAVSRLAPPARRISAAWAYRMRSPFTPVPAMRTM